MRPLQRVGKATGVLTTEEVNYIQTQIVKAVYPKLVARTLMPLERLPHYGFLKETFYTENDMTAALISMSGEQESISAVDLTGHEVKIPLITKDYMLHGRAVEMARAMGRDLNTQNAENAARQCAEDEDILILSGEHTGWPALGIEGLATATGRQQMAGGDWSAVWPASVASAKGLLRAAGHQGPYKVIMPSTFYGQLEVAWGTTEKWAFQALGELIGGEQNIVVTDNLFAADGGVDCILVISTEPGNFAVLSAQEIMNIGPDRLPGSINYKGKVLEAVVPKIMRPAAIVELTATT
jgi:uncharacterized linocin/CFP29 family protein